MDGVPVTVTCRVLKLAGQPYHRRLDKPVTDPVPKQAHRANALFDAHREDPEFGCRFLAGEARSSEAAMAGRNPLRHLAARPAERRSTKEHAAEAMELCGISHLADKRPADLSTGQRRLVELARVSAGDFRLLLLDEPSSGLDGAETERFGAILSEAGGAASAIGQAAE